MKIVLFLIGLCFLFLSCDNTGKKQFALKESKTVNTEILKDSLPSFKQIILPIKNAGISFQEQLVMQSFCETKSREQLALQTGILIADFAYLRYFEKVNIGMQYAHDLDTRFLALDIPQDEFRLAIERLEANSSTPDSLLDVLSDSFTRMTDELVNAQRSALASLLITGAWLETSRLMLCDKYVKNDTERHNAWQSHIQMTEFFLPVLKNFENSEIELIHNGLNKSIKQNKDTKQVISESVKQITCQAWE